jgi:hypothetical protein
MGAADAAVTSKGYVDAAVGAVAGNVTTLQGDVNTIKGDYLKAADKTALQNNIDTLAQDTTTSLNLKADRSFVGALPGDATATTVVGYVQEKTTGIATSGEITSLQTRVKTIEDDYITSTELENSQDAQNLTITAAYQADDATTLQTAKDYADAAKSAAIAAAASDAEKYIDANELAAEGYLKEHQSLAEYAKTADVVTNVDFAAFETTNSAAIQAAQKAGDDAKTAAATADGKAAAAQVAAAANAEDIADLVEADKAFELKANVSGAPKGVANGKYVLTMLTDGNGNASGYGWELIQRGGANNE